MPFKREWHNKIVRILQSADTAFLNANDCYFGGGTAVTLLFGEYRLSNDLDFLCDSQEGYKRLRAHCRNNPLGLCSLFKCAEPVRECRIDQYGVKQFIGFEGQTFKIEFVRHTVLDGLSGGASPVFKVLTLDEASLTATKLTANSDRWLDAAVFGRDIIDLACIAYHLGTLPETGIKKAIQAYGKPAIIGDMQKAAERMLYTNQWETVAAKLDIQADWKPNIDVGLRAMLGKVKHK